MHVGARGLEVSLRYSSPGTIYRGVSGRRSLSLGPGA